MNSKNILQIPKIVQLIQEQYSRRQQNIKDAAPEVFYKKAVLKNFATLLKRDSNTGVFLWILQNF